MSARYCARIRPFPIFVLAFLVTTARTPLHAQITQRVSLGPGMVQGNDHDTWPSISADGRIVAFLSAASDLVPQDTNGCMDVFVRDRQTGTTERVSVDSAGVQGDLESGFVFFSVPLAISGNGRFVAFESRATNLVPGDTNGRYDVFVRDRQAGTTERVSLHTSGAQANGDSFDPAVSPDGRYVAFRSQANNLVSGYTITSEGIYVRDRQAGTTEIASLSSGGVPGNNGSHEPCLSADGRYVAFNSLASNLVPGDVNLQYDIFVRDRQLGTTELVSVDSNEVHGAFNCSLPSISADGRYVAFSSSSNNLVVGDTNGFDDVFVRDLLNGTTERASVGGGGLQANGYSIAPSISADGRYVAFEGIATNLVAGDTNARADVFVRDRPGGTTERVSVSSSGAQGNSSSGYTRAHLSADGRYVAFDSHATNLVQDDTNAFSDVFVRDRVGGTAFTILCEPGSGSWIACPCGNPPGGSGRGCDNSSSTGGASLSAFGGAFVSSDSLTFATAGQRPTATSILLQGNAELANGVVFGQGVRCVGVPIRRLFVKGAVGGSIVAPDFGAGDPTVSARSAAMSSPIRPGQSRWYLVYYRDPFVLGGCPAGSTFNATPTGRVDWAP